MTLTQFILIATPLLIVALLYARYRERRRDVLKDWNPDTPGRQPFNYDPPKPHPHAGYGNDGVER